jgi:cell division protease FtsH
MKTILLSILFFLLVERSTSFVFIQSNPENRKYPISKPYHVKKTNPKPPNYNLDNNTTIPHKHQKYPLSKNYFEESIKRLNSKNETIQMDELLRGFEYNDEDDEAYEREYMNALKNTGQKQQRFNSGGGRRKRQTNQGISIILNNDLFGKLSGLSNDNNDNNDENNDDGRFYRSKNRNKKSENFEVITKFPLSFDDIGGFDKIKAELYQCVDFLTNYTKYNNYNVRIPKGLILEGPPGNGKTLLAKAFAGEANVGFIAVSGSEFQEKYVGVGSSRIRELFKLARDNVPCIIFIDEIDALGRKRSGDGETSSSERDSTLNELLVSLDGFKTNTGVFLIGATNRADLLDPALVRPGRIDKRIYIGLPDTDTRKAILEIHLNGKPHDDSIIVKNMVDLTLGLSGAQIENLLNEAMLNALRYNREKMMIEDIDVILNRIMAGWQPTDHQFTSDIIDHIAIHEMGHAVVGMVAKHHSKMTKVVINLSSPRSPAYTIFEASSSSIYTREALFEHLAILLAGRIAEEVFYDVSITTGAINDFEEAFKLAEKMIVYYGMGKKVIYPSTSEKYKEIIDNEVFNLLNQAYACSEIIVQNSKSLIAESAEILKKDKILTAEKLMEIIQEKYLDIFELNIHM